MSVLRMYELGAAPILSELIPVLQNFGISVLSEEAYEFNFTGDGQAQRVFIQSFQVRSLKGEPLEQTSGRPAPRRGAGRSARPNGPRMTSSTR